MEQDTVESRLEAECQGLEHELKKLQVELNQVKGSAVVNGDNPLLVVYGTKEKHLKAEIEVRSATEPSVNESIFTEEVVIHELQKSVQQLQQLLKCVKTQLIDVQEETKMHTKISSTQEEINQALKHQLEVASAQDDLAPREAQLLERLTEKNSKAVNYARSCMKEMESFIEEHFPVPSIAEIESYRKKRGRNCGDAVIALKVIIESLVNRCLQSPHDPYIQLDDTYWPPYIELLLRTGIAQRHPVDKSLLKLTPFHL